MKTKIIKDPTFTYYSKGGNVEKAIPGRGDGEAKKQLADLEKIEFDVFQNLTDQIQEDFENEKKANFDIDFLNCSFSDQSQEMDKILKKLEPWKV